ncbi:MAG: F0F1 ATP synthase subunit A [Alphaproteobacteria bacterium]|nr:F0F1 ATP synthase subunit A [Alphaproteobacteria bacterium]
MGDPLAQFLIKPLFPIKLGAWDVSFTNSSAFMVVVIVLVTLFTNLAMSKRAMVPGRLQSVAELAYEFVAGLIRDNVGDKGKDYFPFIFTLFMFILTANVVGMVPYTFTVTSHIIVTFAMAAFVFIGVTVIGLVKHGTHWFSFFVPPGLPGWLLPLVVVIEVISYLSRPISLAVRLFANMTAGHTMLKVFGGFVIALGIFGVAPLAVLVALTGLELLIAFLQAYVFTVLTCLYLNDALNLSH